MIEMTKGKKKVFFKFKLDDFNDISYILIYIIYNLYRIMKTLKKFISN